MEVRQALAPLCGLKSTRTYQQGFPLGWLSSAAMARPVSVRACFADMRQYAKCIKVMLAFCAKEIII
jgi:hypothetical protein